MLQLPVTTTLNLFPMDAFLILLFFVKVLFIIGAILYVFFSFIVVRQIQVMRNSVITPFSGFIQLLGILHLLFAFGVLILFLTAL